MFDIDGMVINKPEIFSIRFSRKQGIAIEEILKFFRGEFQKCLVGEADLKDELSPYLQKWEVKESVDEVLKFWFEGEKDIDEKMTTRAKELAKRGIFTCLATNNEKYRVDYLLNKLRIGKYFDVVVSSAEAGSRKPNKEFYEYVLKKLPTDNLTEVMFWDNDEKNIQGAREFGMVARQFKNYEDFVRETERLML